MFFLVDAATSISLGDVLKLIGQASSPTLLALFIVALWKRWVVLGWQYDMILKERDEALSSARHSVTATEKAVDLAQTAKG